jgi:hypothetical protein
MYQDKERDLSGLFFFAQKGETLGVRPGPFGPLGAGSLGGQAAFDSSLRSECWPLSSVRATLVIKSQHFMLAKWQKIHLNV